MEAFFLASLLLGAFAGLAAGLFGIGGGVVIVPVLAWLLKNHGITNELVMIMAIATSLASIIFTSSMAILSHLRHNLIKWWTVFYLGLGIVLGVSLGSFVTHHINTDQLRLLFAVFLFYVGMQMWLAITPHATESKESPFSDYLMGLLTGAVSSLSGTGGGTLIVPYLVSRQMAMKNAVATSSACGFPIALSGSIAYAFLGLQHGGLPEHSFGYIYLPAFLGIALSSSLTVPLGAKLARSLPAPKLKRYFAIVLFLLAGKLLWH
jgi:uncharacterized membrane protein YfcA